MSKILYAASTATHLANFHIPYIEALRAEGHTVLTMASGEGVDFNIPFVKKFFSYKNTLARRKIRRILKEQGFDAVVLNTTLAAFHIRLAMPRHCRPRTVNIVHGYLFSRGERGLKARLLRFCERLVCKKTDGIIVMNDEDVAIANENKFTRGSVIKIRGMGAKLRPASSAQAELLSELDLSERFIMCFVGELSRRKNQRFLICALPLLKMSIPSVALCLVGDGQQREELCRLAEELSVSDAVVFAGYRTDACDLIRAADVYVSASEIEGMPFNIIEALGEGATVVASDIKGHRDLISDGAGFLYGKGDIRDFVDKVRGIYEGTLAIDPQRARAVYADYSMPSVFSDTLEKIKEVIL